MLRLSRRLESRSASRFGSHIRRNYQTDAKLNVFQEKGSFMCTRAAAATIMNNLKGSVWKDVNYYDDYLRTKLAEYDRRFAAETPILEEKALTELFQKEGFVVTPLPMTPGQLVNPDTYQLFKKKLASGFILSTSRPPGNQDNISHSVVIADSLPSTSPGSCFYDVFDPYPYDKGPEDGMHLYDMNDIVDNKISTNLLIQKIHADLDRD